MISLSPDLHTVSRGPYHSFSKSHHNLLIESQSIYTPLTAHTPRLRWCVDVLEDLPRGPIPEKKVTRIRARHHHRRVLTNNHQTKRINTLTVARRAQYPMTYNPSRFDTHPLISDLQTVHHCTRDVMIDITLEDSIGRSPHLDLHKGHTLNQATLPRAQPT